MRLIGQALSFALATFISRVLGFLRDATIAYYFGASHISDAFFIAFRIPNSFRRILGEGGFNAVFVPLYVKALEEGRGNLFLSRVFSLYLLVAGCATLAGSLGADLLISVIAPGVRGTPTGELAVFMARFLFGYLILVGLTAFFMGVLNAHGRFFVPAFSQAVFNATLLLVLILTAEAFGYKALILGVLLGGVLQVLVNLPALVSVKVKIRPAFGVDDDVRRLLVRLLPALTGFGISQISLIVDTLLASFLGTGSVSYLYYASRLYQLPFGVFSVGVANSLLSLLSRKEADRKGNITEAYRLVLLISLPATAGLVTLSEPIVSAIYGRGNFSVEDVERTSLVLSLYSLGLVFFSLQKVSASAFFSRGDTWTPLKASLFTVLSEGLVASSFVFVFDLGLYGLPLATALSSVVGFIYLLTKLDTRPDPEPLLSTVLRVLPSLAFMILLLVWLEDRVGKPVLEVLLLVPSGAFLYFLCLLLLGEPLTLRLLEGLVKKLVKS